MISVLIESALRALVVAALVWGGLRLFRVRNVVAQKAAWGLVLGLAVAMPVLLRATNSWQLLPKQEGIVLPANTQTLLEELQSKIQAKRAPSPPAADVVAPVPTNESSLPSNTEAGQAALSAPPSDTPQVADPADPSSDLAPSQHASAGPVDAVAPIGPVPPKVAPQRPAISAAGVAILLYLVVMAVFFLRLAYGLTAALRLWHTARPIPAEILSGFGFAGRVRSSSRVASPVTVGSAVVLPSDYVAWERDKLRIVLAHECSHVRQGDFYLQLLAGLYAALFWFSPLGWWIKHRLTDLGEAISDRAGLEEAGSRSLYAQLLLEFAAAPRPTPVGVAMARTSNLSRRIEQFLNDRTFQQAFAGGRRALAAVLLVPMAFLAATAFIRVQAAVETQQPAPAPQAQTAPSAPPTEGVSNAEPVTLRQEGRPAPVAAQIPTAPPAPPAAGETVVPQGAPPAPPRPSVEPVAPAPPVAPVPPVDFDLPATHVRVPGTDVHVPAQDICVPEVNMHIPGTDIHVPAIEMHVPARDYTMPEVNVHLPAMKLHVANLGRPFVLGPFSQTFKYDYGYHFSSNGDSYAIVRGTKRDQFQFSGDLHTDQIDKARKLAHGDFLWFTHEGKSYYVDDPSVLSRIEAAYAPMEALGKEQGALGRKQEELGKQQEELGRQQEQVKIPDAEFSREMARLKRELVKARADLEADSRESNQEQLLETRTKLAEMQGELGALQGQVGSRRGDFGSKMGELGRMQAALGARQGRLGAEQGRLAGQADRMVQWLIGASIQNGKAHLVD